MGRYITVVEIDEEAAKKDKENVHVPNWFSDMNEPDFSPRSAAVATLGREKQSDARLHAEAREMRVMLELFSYMGTDQEIDPFTFICKETGYAKSMIREDIEKYVKMGYVKINI